MSDIVRFRPSPMYNLDILSRIARFIPFHFLPNLLRWPNPAKDTVKPETKRRIFARLKPFIPKAARPFFFSNLSDCGGALFGDVVLQILVGVREFEEVYKKRRDLEIIVRRGHKEPMISFFENIGYESQQIPIPEVFESTVESVHELVKEVDGETYRTRIFTSKSQAIAVVLWSPYTAYWNAITANKIVVFCPRLTYCNQSLVCDWHTGAPSDDLPFSALMDNSDWTTTCGGERPMMHRKTLDDAGVDVVQWSPGKEEGESGECLGDDSDWQWIADIERQRRLRNRDFCSSEAIQWRVSHQCHNDSCVNSQLGPARHRVIPTV